MSNCGRKNQRLRVCARTPMVLQLRLVMFYCFLGKFVRFKRYNMSVVLGYETEFHILNENSSCILYGQI